MCFERVAGLNSKHMPNNFAFQLRQDEFIKFARWDLINRLLNPL
jgi:hypothetical protein